MASRIVCLALTESMSTRIIRGTDLPDFVRIMVKFDLERYGNPRFSFSPTQSLSLPQISNSGLRARFAPPPGAFPGRATVSKPEEYRPSRK